MFARLLRAAAPLSLLLATASVTAQDAGPIASADMMRHIERLASDEFQGRAPGTEGEARTIAYIVAQMQARGLEPAGEGGTWFQPVALAERQIGRSTTRWVARGNPVQIAAEELVLMGRDASERIADAPVIFGGHGVRLPERGIDQLAGADVRGAVVLILAQGPRIEGFPSLAERTRTLAEAGAAAVIAVVGADIPWQAVAGTFARGTTRLDATPLPQVVGAIPMSAAQRLVDAAGGDMNRLLNDQPGSSFRAVTLPIRASLEVSTEVHRFRSNNVIGRLRGSGSTGESLLYLAHWDHFGTCRAEGEADRICNGAVDNASGVAMMLEVAGRLSQGPRPARDVLFLATTAEEVGLLGAEYFANNPTVPARSIVAALNMDTVAIHPAGEPVAVIGRGTAPLDRVIDETVREANRTLDADDEADAFVQRQDGYKLAQVGIPSVMVGGSFSNMQYLNNFLGGNYHQPSDQLGGSIPLDGAAEDANLLVALGRRLADPAAYQRPAPAAEGGE